MEKKSIKQKIAIGMMWRVLEKVTASIVTITVSIILARILNVDDYAAIAIVNVFISIAETFTTSGISTALIQKKDADTLDYSSMTLVSILFSLLVYIVLFLCSGIIANIFKMKILKNVIRVLSLKIVISSYNSIQNAYVSNNMDFKKFFFATSIGTIISGILGVVFVYNGFGIWSIVIQYLSNSLIDTIVLHFTINLKLEFAFSIERVKPLFQFGWKVLATDFFGMIYNYISFPYITFYIIGSFFS